MAGPTTDPGFDDLVQGLADPDRQAETARHYRALLDAMNASHIDGAQDFLCVLDAVALLLGQMIGNGGADMRSGLAEFVRRRALFHADHFAAVQNAAPHLIVPDDYDGSPSPLFGSAIPV